MPAARKSARAPGSANQATQGPEVLLKAGNVVHGPVATRLAARPWPVQADAVALDPPRSSWPRRIAVRARPRSP